MEEEKEAAAEEAEPLYLEAVHLYYGLNGTRMNQDAAIACYQRARDMGHEGALGMCLVYGWGMDKNLHNGLALLTRRSDAGDLAASNTLAGHLHRGWGYPRPDSTRAAALFSGAASRGFIPALANLSYLTKAGRGVDENQHLAFQRLLNAAKARYPVALCELGRTYNQGNPDIGLVRNEWLALRSFKVAAQGGCDEARNSYTDMIWRRLEHAVEWRDVTALRHYLNAWQKTEEDVTVSDVLGKPVNVRGDTLLHHAAEIRHTACLTVLLEAVNDIRELRKGGTILHAAARGGNALGIAVLLKHDADPTVKCSHVGETPLHAAVTAAERAAAATRALLAAVSQSRDLVDARDHFMRTPLHRALHSRGTETADCVHQLLFLGKADPNALDGRGDSPLLLAKRTGNVACARLLLLAGAEPLQREKGFLTTGVDAVLREWEHRRHCLLRERLVVLIGAQQAQHPLFGLLPRELLYAIVRYTWHDPPIRTTLLPV